MAGKGDDDDDPYVHSDSSEEDESKKDSPPTEEAAPAAEKRGAERDHPDDDDRAKRRRTRNTQNVYSRPITEHGTEYARRFRASDYELFNQVLDAGTLTAPRPLRSGLTPREYPVNAPPLTPITHSQVEELIEYQRDELRGWEGLELVDLEVIEVTARPNNLSNEIHPILYKERWGVGGQLSNLQTEPYILPGGRALDVREPDIWPHILPVLRLVTHFMSNLQVFEWWDAMWEGRRENIPHPDGPQFPDLTRFFRREGQDRIRNPAQLEKYLHEISWEVSIGAGGIGPTWDGVTWLCKGGPRKPHISLSGSMVEPLLFEGVASLTTA